MSLDPGIEAEKRRLEATGDVAKDQYVVYTGDEFGNIDSRKFDTKFEAEKYVEQQKTRIEYKPSPITPEQTREIEYVEKLYDFQDKNAVEKFLTGLFTVPLSTFVSPFHPEEKPYPRVMSGLVGLGYEEGVTPRIGGRREEAELTRPVEVKRGEQTRKELTKLGSAYIAGGILGEVAQAYAIGKITGAVTSKVSTAISSRLPYTWQVKLGTKPHPIISIEQVTDDAISVLTKKDGVWTREPSSRTSIPFREYKGQYTTPFSETFGKAISDKGVTLSSGATQALQVVMQKQGQELTKALTVASDVKLVEKAVATLPTIVSVSQLGKTGEFPEMEPFPGTKKKTEEELVYVYHIKPGEVKRLEAALNTTLKEVDAVVKTFSDPSEKTFLNTLPILKKETLETIVPEIDQDILAKTIPKLDSKTISKVVPYITIETVVEVLPQLDQVHLEKMASVLDLNTLQIENYLPSSLKPKFKKALETLKKDKGRKLTVFKVSFAYYLSSERFKVKSPTFKSAYLKGNFMRKNKKLTPTEVRIEKLTG